jgi:hypothetical protein
MLGGRLLLDCRAETTVERPGCFTRYGPTNTEMYAVGTELDHRPTTVPGISDPKAVHFAGLN